MESILIDSWWAWIFENCLKTKLSSHSSKSKECGIIYVKIKAADLLDVFSMLNHGNGLYNFWNKFDARKSST